MLVEWIQVHSLLLDIDSSTELVLSTALSTQQFDIAKLRHLRCLRSTEARIHLLLTG